VPTPDGVQKGLQEADNKDSEDGSSVVYTRMGTLADYCQTLADYFLQCHCQSLC